MQTCKRKMAFLKFWASFLTLCLIMCHFQNGSALFLSHKKKSVLNYLVKAKLEKLHAALSDDDDYDIAHYHHYHYEPAPVIVVPHHGLYKSKHYDPWHFHSYHSHHGWSGHESWFVFSMNLRLRMSCRKSEGGAHSYEEK